MGRRPMKGPQTPARKDQPMRADEPAAAPDDAILREFIGYRMKRVYIALQGELLKTLGEFELRLSTFSALMLIVDRPDMTQSQLAQALSIERSGVVLIVDELEGRELISRNKVPTDRRTYALRATLAGVRLREKAMKAVAESEERTLSALSPAERAQLFDLLTRVESGAADEG